MSNRHSYSLLSQTRASVSWLLSAKQAFFHSLIAKGVYLLVCSKLICAEWVFGHFTRFAHFYKFLRILVGFGVIRWDFVVFGFLVFLQLIVGSGFCMGLGLGFVWVSTWV